MKIAVLGFGRQGKRRAQALSELVSQPIVLFDTRPIEGTPIGQYDIVNTVEEAINQVDAVAVCTPSATHYELTKQVLDAGKHVLVEKPLTLEAREASELVVLAKSKKLGLYVGLNMRYRDPAMFAIREASQGEIGRVQYISGSIGHSQFSESVDDPRRVTGGGPLLDSGTHLLDLALRCAGRLLSCDVLHRRVVFNEWCSSVLLVTSDVSINITASYADMRKGVGHRMLIIGTEGSISLRMGDPDDIVTIANAQGVKTHSFSFPDKCWELDCKAFLETCRNPGAGNSEDAAGLVTLLT